MVFDKDQEFRVTNVLPDGQGGFHMYAVATPRTPGETPAPANLQAGQPTAAVPGQQQVRGLTPDQMVGNLESLTGRDLQDRARAVGVDPSGSEPQVKERIRQKAQEALRSAQPAPMPVADNNTPGRVPTGPNAPQPRTEQVVKEAVGGGPVATPATPAAPGGAPEAPGGAPEAPQPGRVTPAHFRELVRDGDVPMPSEGKRRRQWNQAYLGITSGKKDPGDILRELDTDIAVNRRLQQSNEDRGIPIRNCRATSRHRNHLPT